MWQSLLPRACYSTYLFSPQIALCNLAPVRIRRLCIISSSGPRYRCLRYRRLRITPTSDSHYRHLCITPHQIHTTGAYTPAPTHHPRIRPTLLVLMNHLTPCLHYRRLRITLHQAYATGTYESPHIRPTLLALMNHPTSDSRYRRLCITPHIRFTLLAPTHHPHTGLMLPVFTHHFISISISIRESPSHKRRGERCWCCGVAIQVCLRFACVLLPFLSLKKHVARPSSPSIARKSDFCPKKDVKWRDLSVRCGFWLKMETRWRNLPAKLFTHGFSFKKEHNLPAKFYECGASSKKEGGGKNHYFNGYISIEQWEIHVKSWIK